MALRNHQSLIDVCEHAHLHKHTFVCGLKFKTKTLHHEGNNTPIDVDSNRISSFQFFGNSNISEILIGIFKITIHQLSTIFHLNFCLKF